MSDKMTRILYLEDDVGEARLLQKRLNRAGYEVELAFNGEEGIKLFDPKRHDIIAIDRSLPDLNGLDVMRTLLETQESLPPLIMVTGTGDEQTAVEAMRLGAFDYVVKDPPGNYLDLFPAIIERVLNQQRIIEANRQAEKALRESEARYRLLAENTLDLIGLLDLEGHIVYASPSHFRVLGFTPQELSHENILEIVHSDDKAVILAAVQEILISESNNAKVEARLPHKQGDWVVVEAILSIISETDKAEKHILLSARDITQRKQDEETLKRYAAKLHEHNQELDAFAHTVAHDLKTPVSQVIGIASFVTACLPDFTPEELKENLGTILEGGQRMNNIIKELMVLSSVRKLEITPRPVDMASIIANVQNRLAFMIKAYNTQVICPEEWPSVLGYGPWIEEVWSNYISNAIKYGGQSPRVELGATPQSNNMIRFWVRDNGQGLSPEEQSQLFIPFTRLSQIQIEGHGLGLSIVRRIMEKLNGHVGVESEGIPGKGSNFFFTLPDSEN